MWNTISMIGAIVVLVILVVAFIMSEREDSPGARRGVGDMAKLYAQKHPYSYMDEPPGTKRKPPFGVWEVYNGITLCKIHGYRIFHCDYEGGYLTQINIFQLETSNKFAVHTEHMTREKVVTCETYEDAKKEIRRFLEHVAIDSHARALIPKLKKAGMYDGGVEEIS